MVTTFNVVPVQFVRAHSMGWQFNPARDDLGYLERPHNGNGIGYPHKLATSHVNQFRTVD